MAKTFLFITCIASTRTLIIKILQNNEVEINSLIVFNFLPDNELRIHVEERVYLFKQSKTRTKTRIA